MTDPAPTRRSFATWLAGSLAALPFVGGLFVVGRAAATRAPSQGPARVPLCKPSEVPDTGLIERSLSYQLRRGPAVETISQKVFVTRLDGEIVAFSNRCTHLGCPVMRTGEPEGPPLTCPCHDAFFDISGKPLEGPAKRPLERLRLAIPDDQDQPIEVVLG